MRSPRPKFNGEKLVALANESWDMALLIRGYSGGFVSEDLIVKAGTLWSRAFHAAIIKPLVTKRMESFTRAMTADFHAIYLDEDLRERVAALIRRRWLEEGMSLTFGTTAPKADLGGGRGPEA